MTEKVITFLRKKNIGWHHQLRHLVTPTLVTPLALNQSDTVTVGLCTVPSEDAFSRRATSTTTVCSTWLGEPEETVLVVDVAWTDSSCRASYTALLPQDLSCLDTGQSICGDIRHKINLTFLHDQGAVWVNGNGIIQCTHQQSYSALSWVSTEREWLLASIPSWYLIRCPGQLSLAIPLGVAAMSMWCCKKGKFCVTVGTEPGLLAYWPSRLKVLAINGADHPTNVGL